jgi:FAD/FMN-containing dehydrogenase/Fe-S oxidoreductase
VDLQIEGDVFVDESSRLIYATDASAYREKPLKVVLPAGKNDIISLVKYAGATHESLIPRGAGTSLAGQVVGNGIVVDTTRYMNKILEINAKEKWVRVEPGVIRDELNLKLKEHNLFFAPETSTSNRCVIGGMIGNNASGLHSLIYGTTREHLLSVKAILSDGSEAEFQNLSSSEFKEKCQLNSREGDIYRHISDLLSKEKNQKKIEDEFPDSSIVRRNTGYALDELIDNEVFSANKSRKFNFSKLIAGSEGTLAFIIEAKLGLTNLPPDNKALICVHLDSVMDAIRANLIALKYKPGAVELMDDKILELSKKNIEQQKNRFFIKGDPGALLMIEFARDNMEEIVELKEKMVGEMVQAGLGYHFPMMTGNDIQRVWNLRKAGLGVLSNMPGDAKSVSVTEDTSVNPQQLEAYIGEFNQLLKKYKLECVYHAHISVGELHLRPILNLKDTEDVKMFRTIALETAKLVKKYKGSLSGEHGDGRLRGEFIPIMVGEEVYQWFIDLKRAWDPDTVFNKGKIVETPPMNTFLRYEPGKQSAEIETILDFSEVGGILRAAEKCNGSGDCRKTEIIGGAMCPSYMATRNESATTRARANLLREFITKGGKENPFNHPEVYKVLDLCLSCKACKAECPSNVDMAKLKAEFLQHYYDKNGIPLRNRMIAYITSINKISILVPRLFNYFVRNPFFSYLIKRMAGFAKKRSIPLLGLQSLHRYIRKNRKKINTGLKQTSREVVLFIDEFTNYNDTEIGIKTIKLLNRLGYKVITPRAVESGRTFISKGLLRTARKKAIKNIEIFSDIVNEDRVLIGIEPSAILSFRDEYPDLVRGDLKIKAKRLSKHAFMLEEFIGREFEKGNIKSDQFTDRALKIKLHGHCQQKAIASVSSTVKALSIPVNYSIEEIPSGCCGMAGSFGYEKEHYDVSIKVGELVLFPAIRNSAAETVFVAPGTSCRHQIMDGTGKIALHPAEVLYDAVLTQGIDEVV